MQKRTFFKTDNDGKVIAVRVRTRRELNESQDKLFNTPKKAKVYFLQKLRKENIDSYWSYLSQGTLK